MLEGLAIIAKATGMMLGQMALYGGGGLLAICLIGQAVMDWKARHDQ